MYMDFDLDLNKDFVFTTDNGCLKGGGFKINSHLLNNTFNNSITQKGGSNNHINISNDLVIPSGLFFTQEQNQKNHNIRYEHQKEFIDDSLFDKLLTMVEPNKMKLHGRKTKRKREKKNKITRKNKT